MDTSGTEKWMNEDTDALFDAILKLRTRGEARRFFRDLLTEKEIMEAANRWKAVRMLEAGRPYADIEKATKMSSRTIARISEWRKNGTQGYALMLKRCGAPSHHHDRTSKEEIGCC